MGTLRDCIRRFGKAIKPADAEALHETARQYVADGHPAALGESRAVQSFIDEANEHLDSVYRQAGVERNPAPVVAAVSPIPAPVLPASKEQKLNDSDLNLPPVATMSRQAKRAELDAAGITEYDGKPLDEANPAQISAAVGKLRRGELGRVTPQDSRGIPVGIDSTSLATIQFRDASGPEVSADDRAILAEFERALNQRLAPGSPRYRLTAKEVSEDTGMLQSKLGATSGVLGVGRSGQVLRLRETLEKTFGKRILFVDYGVDGAQNAGTSAETPNTILVNTRSTQPFSALFGHELSHSLKAQRPDLYSTMEAAILRLKPMPIEYETNRRRFGYNEKQIPDEYISDMVGDRFHEPEFWDEIGRQAERTGNTGKFRELLAHVNEWLGGVLRKIAGLNPVTATKAIRDIEQMRAVIADAMVKYAVDPASPAARTTTEPANPAVQAGRTQQFQTTMGRLVANGANVQAMSQELLAQQTGEILQKQIAVLQQRLQQAATIPERNALAKQIAIREQRMSEVAQMRGVTYSPYHIAIAMDDVMNASLDNFVTLLHEAAESLTMRLPPEQRGAVFRAVEATRAEMTAKMQAAAKNTGATVANVPDAGELLAESLAQSLAAEGIPESPSLAQAIVRWLKEIYYRTSMSLQRAFGAEPNLALSLDWYENQLRRELGGDYQYSAANLLNRFLPQSNQTIASKLGPGTGTPGGLVDFYDPVTKKLRQPWVEPTSEEAQEWNMRFQTTGTDPNASNAIPQEEADIRTMAAAYADQAEWLEKLRVAIAPQMNPADFWVQVGRGARNPTDLLAALEAKHGGKYADLATARIGGERMTPYMNGWANHQVLEFFSNLQTKQLDSIAKLQESVVRDEEKFTEHTGELNRLEPDVRNAELHETEIKRKVRELIDGFLKNLKNGLRTSEKLGKLIRDEEGLGDNDPLPAFYAEAYQNLLAADIPLFDYVGAIAMMDLPLSTMEAKDVWKAIRENADTNPQLQGLTRNKPLGLLLSAIAVRNARQMDQIQLRKADAETFMAIRRDLEGIRNATEAQLRVMIDAIDERAEAKGLRQRIKAEYLKERRAIKRASDRLAAAEARIALLEKAKPVVAEKVGQSEQAIGGVHSDWQVGPNKEFFVMRRDDDGTYRQESKKLEFKPDGSAVDWKGLVNDLALNNQWLKENEARRGTKEYNLIEKQTRALEMLDGSRAYQAHNYVKVLATIDRFVRPLQAIARQAAHAAGNLIDRQFNQYGFILRSGRKALEPMSFKWGSAKTSVMRSVGIEDHGRFKSQIYNPVKFFLGVNKGLDQSQAIRAAIKEARKRLTKEPSADFDERFERFLLIDKQIDDELMRIAEENNVFVSDPKLKDQLRRAMARGWSTGMRSMNTGLVSTLTDDMGKLGWTAPSKDRQSTFADVVPPAGADEATVDAYFAQLDDANGLRALLSKYFTPRVINDWLVPFINKPGEPVFTNNGDEISQLDVQAAWAASGGDVLNWIDTLGNLIGVKAEGRASPSATFRADMLKQLDRLYAWESKMAHEASQTPELFADQSTKMHVLMDARVNDLLPAEHVDFASHDPTTTQQMLGQIAFHGAFGRNGAALVANLGELTKVLQGPKQAFDGLPSSTVAGKKEDAKKLGLDYDQLKAASARYDEVNELKSEIEGALGVKNAYGPLYDVRAGIEMLNLVVGQLVDNPKVGLLNLTQIAQRPFAQHSLGLMSMGSTAVSYAEFMKNALGGILRDLHLDLIRMGEFARETGEVEGKAFRRLPLGTVIAGDIGKEGYQGSLTERMAVRPMRILRALQKKGIGPGIMAIPGLGSGTRFATEAAIASNRGTIWLLQKIINRGIKHFAAHPEDLNNPAFTFTADDLKMRWDRGVFDTFRNKTVEYNMGPIESIVRGAIERQQRGERTVTTKMVEQLAQMNAQELDGASSINTAPAFLANNRILNAAMPLLRWPLWIMHKTHEGLADSQGQMDLKSIARGVARLAAWNLPLGLAFTFLIDEYDEKVLGKKNATPEVEGVAGVPFVGPALALASTDRGIPEEAVAMARRSIRAGNIYGLGADMFGTIFAPFDPGSGQRSFSLDQRVLVMSQLSNFMQGLTNWASQKTPTWGNVWRPFVSSIGGNGMLNSLGIINNMLELDNAEARNTMRINAARWVNTAAKEAGIDTKKGGGYSLPTPMSVWTREMQLAAMANDRMGFMDSYNRALAAARNKLNEDGLVPLEDREKEATARVLASWRSRNPFSGLAHPPTEAQVRQLLSIMDEDGRRTVMESMGLYNTYTGFITPTDFERQMNRRLRAPQDRVNRMRRRAAEGMLVGP